MTKGYVRIADTVPVADKYRLSDYDVSGNPLYVGMVDENGSWYITRIDTAMRQARYAKGTSDYATNWSGRAALSYDYYFTVY